MVKVIAPDCFRPEVTYVWEVLFHEFMNIPYQLEFSPDNDCYRMMANGFAIEMGCFFFTPDKNEKYLDTANLPRNVKELTFAGISIISLYGGDSIVGHENVLEMNCDLVGAAFFMLTRWEEHVIEKRDNLNRFRALDSIACKHKFIHRPVVNEYAELLKILIKLYLGVEARASRSFTSRITCDVDALEKWYTFRKFLEDVYRYTFSGKIRDAIWTKLKYLGSKSGISQDPFDTFDQMMYCCEQKGLKMSFFFIAGGKTKYDGRYSIFSGKAKKLMKKIKSRGHEIGIHPSFDSYNQPDLFSDELRALESESGIKVTSGRQHYLRFEVPVTWRIWNDQGMEWESSMTYADVPGFRTGSCYAYSVFDILKREHLKLKEFPLTVMDQTFIGYLNLSPEQALREIKKYLSIVKSYRGDFVLLWHNSSFNTPEMRAYNTLYEAIVNEC